MKNTLLTLIFCVSFIFAGCQTIGERDSAVRIPITYATLSVIDEDKDKAQRVYDLSHEVLRMLDDEVVIVDIIEQQIRGQIKWENLSLADKVLVEELLVEIRFQVNKYVEDDVLDGEAKARLSQIIGYVIRAAELSGASK